jgi:hypothetical protein
MENNGTEKTTEVVEEKKKLATLDDLSADELKDIVRQTRAEAKTYRVSLRELQKEKEQFETAKRTEQEDKLKADGEFQKLLAEREKEILAMKPKADAFEQLRQVEIEEAKKSLGDKWDDEYQTLSIPALRKTTSLLSSSKMKVDGVDDGKIPDPPKVQLTEAQRKDAHEKFPYQTKEQAERNWFDVLRKTGKI